ncbi:glycosyltransferase [Alsobacter sp. SYSU M60028]|uniref:Glycosyltransferase n=1 Tax=Alsobacter ponti TaxID=2962936 RepID=A0ABT1L9D5_9HYPH|nr:glycosyltransferase [Alsobacter ponti]MCP8938101.1 glycosyltransferase [Alsobacter ponti]
MRHWDAMAAIGRARLPDDELVVADLAFLLEEGVSPFALAEAVRTARRIGSTADRVLIAEGVIGSDAFYAALARRLGLQFLSVPFTPARFEPRDAARSGLALLAGPGPARWVAAPRGAQIGWLLRHWPTGAPASLSLTTPARLDAELLREFGGRAARDAVNRLPSERPRASFRDAPSDPQLVALVALAVAAALGLALHPAHALDAFSLACSVVFLLALVLRLAAVDTHYRLGRVAGGPIEDADLPVYTVLVPLYREAGILPSLVAHLRALDYPRAKLDIKLLVEAHDEETIRVAREVAPDAPFEVVVCPPGEPRTKPRALNIGLRFARGDLVVVFDAEDRPAPDQLRRAASVFQDGPDDLACLQCALAIDNGHEGWLPRMFSLEYALLFDAVMPGYALLGLPIPLGGTSNHFRTRALDAALAWDAWNVTEDADLGLRLAELGLRVGALDSATYEEAPTRLRDWFMQRRRWMKGWMQTAVVHSRLGRDTWVRLGFGGSLAVATHTLATLLAALGGPLFLLIFVWKLATGDAASHPGIKPALTFSLSTAVLALGPISVLWPILRAARTRGLRLRFADALCAIPYLLLLTAASWVALWELIVAPFHWNKTPHRPARLSSAVEMH